MKVLSHEAGSMYERYYELVKQAMLDQVDRVITELPYPVSPGVVKSFEAERSAVVCAWRSASQVPPQEA